MEVTTIDALLDREELDGKTTFDFAQTDNDEFHHDVIPYVSGYISAAGYGITEIGFVDKTITVKPVKE